MRSRGGGKPERKRESFGGDGKPYSNRGNDRGAAKTTGAGSRPARKPEKGKPEKSKRVVVKKKKD